MTQVTRFAWPLPVMGSELGFARSSNTLPDLSDPIDWAHGSNGASIQVAVSVTEFGEILEGETVESDTTTGGSPPADPTNANDRDYSTNSVMSGGFFGGSYWWECDFGSAVEVTSMAVDKPVLPVASGLIWQNPTSAVVEWSDNGTSWTVSTTTYSESTVPTGLAFPDPTTTTRYTYTLDTPSTHRWWRIRKSVSLGVNPSDGMAEWLVYGSSSTAVEWQAAPAANDGNDSTYATSDATFAGLEWLQVDLGTPKLIYRGELRVGHTSSGSKTLELYGSADANFTTPVLLDSVTQSATGGFTADDWEFEWTPSVAYQYYRIESADTDRRVYDLNLFSAAVGGSVIEHGQLIGRDDADQHPASAVTVTDSAGLYAAATVEAILGELGAKAIGYFAHGNTGTTETFDAATGWHSATLNANCTFTLTAAPTGTVSSLFLELTQDGTGGRTITLPASVTNKADLEADQDTTASQTTFLVLLSRDGGTTWYGGWWGQGGDAAIDYAEAADIAAVGTTASAGVSTEIPRADHVHPVSTATLYARGVTGPILISDTPAGSPLVFADLLQNEDGTDLIYADLLE